MYGRHFLKISPNFFLSWRRERVKQPEKAEKKDCKKKQLPGYQSIRIQSQPKEISVKWYVDPLEGQDLTLASRGLVELFSSCAVVSVFGSGGK